MLYTIFRDNLRTVHVITIFPNSRRLHLVVACRCSSFSVVLLVNSLSQCISQLIPGNLYEHFYLTDRIITESFRNHSSTSSGQDHSFNLNKIFILFECKDNTINNLTQRFVNTDWSNARGNSTSRCSVNRYLRAAEPVFEIFILVRSFPDRPCTFERQHFCHLFFFHYSFFYINCYFFFSSVFFLPVLAFYLIYSVR